MMPEEPQVAVERVQLGVRMEKRMVQVLKGLAEFNDMTLGQLLEEIVLHSFEPAPGHEGEMCASPHGQKSLAAINDFKRIYGMDYDTHAGYGFYDKQSKMNNQETSEVDADPAASALRTATSIQHAATECTRQYVAGMHTGRIESLWHVHYDRPLWGLTDYFQALEVLPEEAVRIVRHYQPGPHLIGVMTRDTQATLAPYAALGYRPVSGTSVEPIMTKSLSGFTAEASAYQVQTVTSEEQRHFYNSVIDPADPHGQIQAEELHDAHIRLYYVEQDGVCACTGKIIVPSPEAIVVEPLATHKDYRRRGIAAALMERAQADAAALGATRCVIAASPMGRMLYESLGYGVAGYHQSFVPTAGG